MTKRASTFRIDADVQGQLATLSRILRRPMNSLVNEAVRAYVEQRSRVVEVELEADLASLRAYRRGDPDFEQAIVDFAKAEVAGDDPVEGVSTKAEGPVQKKIHRLLNG
jgi:predicted transcriptional regulator